MPSQTVDEYIALYPEPVQALLRRVRETLRAALPDAAEKISYGIPTYYQGGNIIHFGGAKKHIGLYPGAVGIAAFADRLSGYAVSKGAVQFPLDQPIPYPLIAEIAAYCLQTALAAQSQPARAKAPRQR